MVAFPLLSYGQSEPARERLEFNLQLEGSGEVILCETDDEQGETTQLLLKRPGKSLIHLREWFHLIL
jgi:hypothetical protein